MGCHGGAGNFIAWLAAVGSIVVMCFFILWGNSCRRSTRLSSSTKRESSAAIRSAFIFVLMAVPLTVTEVHDVLPVYFRAIYHWLPFWYVCIVTTHWGSCLAASYYSLLGPAVAVPFMFFMNYFMPGGAGPWGRDLQYVEGAWFPGGFSRPVALLVATCFCYAVFASPLNSGTKQYGLGILTELIIEFCNPAQNADSFKAILITYENHIVWGSPVLSLVYLLITAVVLGILTLPVGPHLPCCPRETVLCRRDAIQGYAVLAEDTIGCLERLVTHFREGTSAFALESSYFYIRQLGSRRTELEKLLEGARWETTDAKLDDLRRLSSMLRGIRQMLRVLLEDLKQLAHTFNKDRVIEIAVQMDSFLAACRDSVNCLSDQGALWNGADPDALQRALSCSQDADRHLVCALEQLQLQQGGDSSSSLELIFIETLRSCPTLINGCINERSQKAPGRKQWIKSMLPGSECAQQRCTLRNWLPSRSSHLLAMRLCTSWILAVLWCVYKRNYASGTAVTVAFIWSDTLGAMFQTNINKMLGTAMGLVLGTLPAVLLSTSRDASTSSTYNSFPQDLIIYLTAMFVMWVCAVYGYLAKGAKWAYAYKLWAGLGGVQMLKLLPSCRSSDSLVENMRAASFMSMVDSFMACLLLTLVDLIFALSLGKLTVQQVARAIPDSLSEIGDIVQRFRKKEAAKVNLETLQRGISCGRAFHSDAQTEDLVWSTLFAPEYNSELVLAILDGCDAVYVAAWGLKTSAQRCSRRLTIQMLLDDLLPNGLAERAKRYSAIARAALLQEDAGHFPEVDMGESECALDLGAHQSPWNRRKKKCMDELQSSCPGDAAAFTALQYRSWTLCVAVQQLGCLFKEQAFWAAEDWRIRGSTTDSGSMSFGLAMMKTTSRSSSKRSSKSIESAHQVSLQGDHELQEHLEAPPEAAASEKAGGHVEESMETHERGSEGLAPGKVCDSEHPARCRPSVARFAVWGSRAGCHCFSPILPS